MKTNKRILFYAISDDSILAINTLTGAIDVINSQVYQALYENDGFSKLDELTQKRLIKRGYLLQDMESEARWWHIIEEAYAKTEKRLSFTVCPTYSCNLQCSYCFEGDLTHSARTHLGKADVKMVFSAIDDLMQTYSNRRYSIDLFGGEPLLPRNRGFVSALLDEAKVRALPVSIVTNGVFAGHYEDLLETHKDQISFVQITIDGAKDIHNKRRKSASNKGSYDEACSAVSMLLGLGVKVVVRTNIDLQNLESIIELSDCFKVNGWTENPRFSWSLSPVQDHACKKSYEFLISEDLLIEKLLDLFKKNPEVAKIVQPNMFRTLTHIRSVLNKSEPAQPLLYYCEANNLESIVFGADGYLYACTECMGSKDMAIGKFRPHLQMHDEVVKQWDGRNVLSIEKCRECDIALLCGGGCAYSALAVNGDINEPVCNRARETIFAYLDYMKDELAG